MLREISETNKEFKKYIYKNALYYYLKIFGSQNYNTNLNDSVIQNIINSAEMIEKSAGEILSVEGGGMLFSGLIRPINDDANNSDDIDVIGTPVLNQSPSELSTGFGTFKAAVI